MRKLGDPNEDLTPFVKEVLKEAEEELETQGEAEGADIADIAEKMDMDDTEVGEEEEAHVIQLEMDALVDLVGEDDAQKIYDKCMEKGQVPLTSEDIEECCPAAEEPTPEEGELEGYEEGAAVGAEEAAEGEEEVEEFAQGFEDATEDIEAVGDEECPEGGGDDEECPEGGDDDPEGGCVSTGDVAAGDDVEAGDDVSTGANPISPESVEGGEDDEDPHAAALARKGEDEDPHAAALARKDDVEGSGY